MHPIHLVFFHSSINPSIPSSIHAFVLYRLISLTHLSIHPLILPPTICSLIYPFIPHARLALFYSKCYNKETLIFSELSSLCPFQRILMMWGLESHPSLSRGMGLEASGLCTSQTPESYTFRAEPASRFLFKYGAVHLKRRGAPCVRALWLTLSHLCTWWPLFS